MGSANDIEGLLSRAQLMREAMTQSQTSSDNMNTIFGRLDHRLSTVEAAMRPTPVSLKLRKVNENIEKTLKELEVVLMKFDAPREQAAKILAGPQGDLSGYLVAIYQLQSTVEFFTQNRSYKSSEAVLIHASGLISEGMIKVEEEFKAVLDHYSKVIDPASLSDALSTSLNEATSRGVVCGKGWTPGLEGPVQLPRLVAPRYTSQLNEMAQLMIGAGHHERCLKVYRDVRSATLEQNLRRLGVENLGKEDVQKIQLEALEGMTGNWIRHIRAAVKVLFAGERNLFDQIFSHLDPHRDKAFVEVAGSSTTMLISFGDAIASSKKSPENLFVLLDMYETMRDLLPEIEVLFSGEFGASICKAACDLLKKLTLTASGTFGDFENAVRKDATMTPVLNGNVHPLTSYVMNYVKFLLDYQSTLRQLFDEQDAEDKSDSKLADSIKRIILELHSNLDRKSKLYKDPALGQLFLMNNTQYVVKSVRLSEAKEWFGKDWLQRQRRIVQQCAAQFQRHAWGKAVSHLSGSGLTQSQCGSGGTGISKSAVKVKLKSFNELFEDLYTKQSHWIIPDAELRDAVRLQVEEVLLPAYRSFVERYSPVIENEKNPQKYLKYSAEELARLLDGFFEGKATPA